MRSRLLSVFIAALAIGSLAPAAPRAQAPPSPETMEAAQNVFALLFDHAFARQNESAVRESWPSLERSLRKNNPALDDATLSGLRQDYLRIRRERLKELVKELPNAMARHLNAKEMNDLAAFYSTPSGIKVLEAMPFVLTEGFAQVLPRMRAFNDDTHDAFMKLLRERELIRAHP